MSIKLLKPTTPGQRGMSKQGFEEITSDKPERSLLAKRNRTGGRTNNGRITTRHIGGGHKRRYRIIDFKRNKIDVPAKVATIESLGVNVYDLLKFDQVVFSKEAILALQEVVKP